jgi:dipeptide/tripeptide permease
MIAFLVILLLAGLMVAFAHRLPGPTWLWKIVRFFALMVLVLGIGFIVVMLLLHFFDVQWH